MVRIARHISWVAVKGQRELMVRTQSARNRNVKCVEAVYRSHIERCVQIERKVHEIINDATLVVGLATEEAPVSLVEPVRRIVSWANVREQWV